MDNDWFHEYFINELKAIGRKPTSNMQHEVVDSLPSSGNEQTIYFVKNDSSSSNNHYDEYVWISSSSTFEKIGSTQIDGSATQPDWNQNDATQPDYVKNRPFYAGDPVETVLIEETTAPFAEDEDTGLYIAGFPLTFNATVGETYKVSWDGAVYECISVGDFNTDAIAIGNMSIVGGHDTGEPFFIAINGEQMGILTADTSASHTFSISRIVEQVVKIDPKYLSISSKPAGEFYLTFSSPNKFILGLNGNTKHWDGTLEYFTSNDTWTIWDGTSNLSAITNGGEYVLYLRGTGNTVITGSGDGWSFNGTDIKCIGNIENLLDYATVKSGVHPGMSDHCYSRLFQGCTSLTQAPDLPATRLATGCYQNMFYGCTSLTQAPALPATILTNYCYNSMFYGCSSLTQTPDLHATTLASGCYNSMFRDCTSLTQIPVLPATTLADGCYMGMFEGCTSIKLSSTKTDEYTQEYRMPASGNGTTASNALSDMFASTGGTFAGTPSINTTYYLSSDNMIVRETEIATLNGYVDSMINTALSAIGIAEEGAY